MLLKLIDFYKRFITPLLGRNCRYYPSCSTYARWQLENSPLLPALWNSTLRLLRCNQLFPGGIDYPIVSRKFPPLLGLPPVQIGQKVKYWFVPVEGKRGKFYIVASDKYDNLSQNRER